MPQSDQTGSIFAGTQEQDARRRDRAAGGGMAEWL